MPPRQTNALDIVVPLDEVDRTAGSLERLDWTYVRDLELYEDLRGSAWRRGSAELDLIGLPGEWSRLAVYEAARNVIDGLPTLTLPYLVLMKLISARVSDAADIGRMLGHATSDALSDVRRVVRRWHPQDLDDLEQMSMLGKLEYD